MKKRPGRNGGWLRVTEKGDPSPNPEGRPPGGENLSTILRRMLEEDVDVFIDGKKHKKKFKEVILRKLLKKAHDGEIKAIQEIFDRAEGKPKQSIDLANLPPIPITGMIIHLPKAKK